MRSQNSKVKKNSGATSTKSGKLDKNADVDSKLLKQLSSKMGNQGLNDRLQQSSGERDTLLQFICAKLKSVQHIQQIELDEVSQRPEWFRDVAKGEQGFFLPDPERWKETAGLYKKAGQALCQGNVSKGKQLLEEAIKKEADTRESVPEQVERRLESKDKNSAETPVSTASEGGEVCPARNAPKDLDIADKILSVRATVKNAPPIRRTRSFKWWEQDKEDEDDNTTQEETEENEQDRKEEHEDEDHMELEHLQERSSTESPQDSDISGKTE